MVKYRRPLEDNIIFRLLHIHAFAHFISSFFAPISKQNFYDLREKHKPAQLLADYDKVLLNPNNKNPSLKQVLFKLFKKDLIIGIIMSIVVALLLIQSPLIMKKILLYIDNPNATTQQTKAVKGVITMFVIAFIIKIFFNELTERKFFMIGLRLQLLLTNLFMRKITKLSLNDLQYSKPQVMNYLIVQIKKVQTFFKKGSWLFSQPPVLVLGLLMIFIKNFWLGFIMLQIIFGFIILKVLGENHMLNSHHHKLQIQQKRIYTNVELFKQMRQMKTIGYNELLSKKQLQYIQKQNGYNIKYMSLKHLIQLFLVLVPFVFFFICFLLRLKDESIKKLSLVDCYIVLIYAQILVPPLKNIRYILLYFEDLTQAIAKLQTFLNLDQIQKIIYFNKNLLVSSIKFKNIKINRQNIAIKSAEKSEVQYFLLQKTKFVSSPGRKTKNYFQIPFSIQLKPGDHLIVLGQKDEGSVLLSLLAGNIILEEGEIQYNGKTAYVSSQLWLVQGTIKDNILMGQAQNQASLRLVYDITQLSTDFQTHLQKKELTLITSSSLTQSHKRRISLARALYVNADIYLLDNIFKGVPQKTAQLVYAKISKYLYERTMIIATNNILDLQPHDKVLLFVNKPRTIQYGQVQKLQSTENSNLQKYLQNKIEDQQEESITIQVQKQVVSDAQVHRQPLVPFSIFKQFLSYGSLNMVYIVGGIIIVIQLLKLYLDLVLGRIHQTKSIKVESVNLTHYNSMFFSLILLQGLFSFIQLYTSDKLTKNITKDLSTSIANNIPIQDIQGEHQTSLIEIVSKDYEQVFVLMHRFPALISYIMILVITIGLLLFCSPKLLVYIIGLLVFNGFFFYFLLRTQRQIRRYKSKFLKNMYDNVFTFIDGVETIKHYADPKQFYIERSSSVTDYAVYIQNQRFVWHAVKMIGQITTLMITYWTMQFAVGKRAGLTKSNIIFLFAALTYCLKLSGLIYYIIEELIEIESAFRKTVSKMLSIIHQKTQQDYKLIGNIVSPNLRVQKLYLGGDDEINFNLTEGEKTALYGPRSKILLLNYLITKTVRQQCKGKITLNNINVLDIPPKTIHKQIYHLTTTPFVFSGTIRQNIDPFDDFKQSEILTAVRLSDLLQILNQTNQSKCCQEKLIYQNVSNNVRHAINVARVILKKPTILLVQLSHLNNLSQLGSITFNQMIQNSTALLSNPGEQLKRVCDTEIKI